MLYSCWFILVCLLGGCLLLGDGDGFQLKIEDFSGGLGVERRVEDWDVPVLVKRPIVTDDTDLTIQRVSIAISTRLC